MPSPPDVMLRTEVVRDLAALEALRPAWERLPAPTPFQSPAWLIPWMRHLGRGALLTLAVRDGATLAGLLPLYVHTEPGDGTRKLFPLGIGTTDYLDGLAAPGREAAVARAASRVLADHAGEFDHAEWPQLRADALLRRVPAPPGWSDATAPGDPCPAVALPRSFESLGEAVSRKTLRDLRTARRRAAGLRWETGDGGDLDALLDALLRLHAARWRLRGEAGVLADPAVQAMQREALPALQAAGLLRLLALREGDAVVAVLHALADPPGRAGRRLYFYIAGFEPTLDRLSPGMLLVGEAIERAIAEGIAVADFLRGEERYKSFWGARPEATCRRRLIPAGTRA